MIYRRFKYAGSTGAIFRKTYPELEGNHIRPLLEEFPELREYWHESKKLLTLPNGSTLQFCHCNNEADIGLYQGREFHDLAIDEAGQWTEAMFRKLLGSNRSSKPGIKARAILTGNPGGPGHQWLKRLFVEKRFNERERREDYAFIQALVDDNPALIDNDPDYVARLESEPNQALRKAYRYGSWDIFAGQFFSEISREVHFIAPFNIPHHWNRFGSYDYGFNHPAAFGWFAVDEDGTVYQYRELVQAGLRVDEFAAKLRTYPDTLELGYITAGWDCWAKKGTLQSGSSPTIAEEFLKHEIILSRAKIDRVQGAAQIRSYLAVRGTRPRFYMFNNCPISFDALTRMEHDENKVEDVLKVDAVEGDPTTGDDAYDMVRYALMSRPLVSEVPKFKGKPGTDEWIQFQSTELEKSIDKQIERQVAEEKGEDIFNVSFMDEQSDIVSYYLNKRSH
jgi:phage terminase large subunit